MKVVIRAFRNVFDFPEGRSARYYLDSALLLVSVPAAILLTLNIVTLSFGLQFWVSLGLVTVSMIVGDWRLCVGTALLFLAVRFAVALLVDWSLVPFIGLVLVAFPLLMLLRTSKNWRRRS
jgi:hypothetical protein